MSVRVRLLAIVAAVLVALALLQAPQRPLVSADATAATAAPSSPAPAVDIEGGASLYLDELPPLGSSPATTVAAVVRLALAVPDPVPPAAFVPAPEGLVIRDANNPVRNLLRRNSSTNAATRNTRDFFAATLLGSAELNGAPPRAVFTAKGPGEPSWLAVATGFGISKRSNTRAKVFARIAIAGKALYCRRWAHDLYAFDLVGLVRASGLRGRSVLWGKTLAVAAALAGGHAWVAWHDADMIFVDFDFSFTDFVTSAESMPPPARSNSRSRRASDDDGVYDRNATVDFIIGSEDDDVRKMDLNTGHYLMRNAEMPWRLMHESFGVPATDVRHDQDAFAILLGTTRQLFKRDPEWQANVRGASTSYLKQHTRVVTPLHVMGGWLSSGVPRWRLRYEDAHAHFSGCDERARLACAYPATHLFATGLALAGFDLATVPFESLVEVPPPQPSVRERTSGNLAVVVAAVDDQDAAAASSLAAQAEAAGAAFYEVRHSDVSWRAKDEPRHPAKDALRVAETVLPYHEWVLVAAAQAQLSPSDPPLVSPQSAIRTLLDSIPNGTDFVRLPPRCSKHAQSQAHAIAPVPVVGGSKMTPPRTVRHRDAARAARSDCSLFLVRRTRWSFALLRHLARHERWTTPEHALVSLVALDELPLQYPRSNVRYVNTRHRRSQRLGFFDLDGEAAEALAALVGRRAVQGRNCLD